VPRIIIVTLLLLGSSEWLAAEKAASALRGRVSSKEEGSMEGVLVSARKDGSTVTTSVVSDSRGEYSFPKDRLESGHYSIRIRAAGYDLADPKTGVDIGNRPGRLDLNLVPTRDLAAQMTNADWLFSAPGAEEQRKALLNCQHCHTMERIFRSHHTPEELQKVMHRMGTYYEGTTPQHPQLLKPMPAQIREYFSPADVDYVSSIILGAGSDWKYPLKTLPRPKGEQTKAIVTEFELPRKGALPHDAVIDREGMIWYCDHGAPYVGRLDPKTSNVVEFPTPILKPGFPTGCHFIEQDADRNLWITLGAQGGVAKFDRSTQTFKSWSLPQMSDNPEPMAYALMVENAKSDGQVWVMESTGRRIQRLNVNTGTWLDPFPLFQDIPENSPASRRRHFVYDMHSDSKDTVYLLDYYSEFIGKMDFRTGKTVLMQTPTFDSGPRRGHIDSQGRVWFGEYRGNRIGMFDPGTGGFKEWEMPIAFSGPYDVVVDKQGFAWTSGMTSDRVFRLNIQTGKVVDYLLPSPTNARRVEVDDSKQPVTFWTGSNHGGVLVRLEPRE